MMNLLTVSCLAGLASAVNLTISSTGGNASSPLAYGLMFEDISHSGDGGIYAELIRNRAFQGSTEYPSTTDPWFPVGNATLSISNSTNPPLSSSLPNSILVTPTVTKGKVGLQNPGWWGIPVLAQKYVGSFWVLGTYKGQFKVRLQSSITGEVYVTIDISSDCKAGTWVEHTFDLSPHDAAPNVNNTLAIEYDADAGPLNFGLISLFPPTYKDRANGMRKDLMTALKALNPSFLRMPGGNNVEGDSYHYPWRWNQTIGPLTERPGRPGTWGYENTDGLGLIEYFNWCTDLEMEPLLAIWSGMYLGSGDVLSAANLAPYVNDTLNELEFLLGSTSTTYGALRSSLGYPNPFTLKYIEIGNEDNLDSGAGSYASYRFSMFYNAIHALYPDITIISSTGDYTAVAGTSVTDYHVYTRPDAFVQNFNFFDTREPLSEHGTLVGEYATIQYNLHDEPTAGADWSASKMMYPIWSGAVAEAIFALGAERNGDKVLGMSYAPGFQNLNSYVWSPDLISFTADPTQTVLSTSYRGIELFSNNRYEATVPVTSDSGFSPAYWVAGINSTTGRYTFKTAIYNATEPIPFNISFEGVAAGGKASLTVLTAPDGLSGNGLVNGKVSEVVNRNVTALVAGKEGTFEFELGDYSIAVLVSE